jgi:HK97 family phage portal protein/HK97 family phage prohead protease
MGWLQRLFTRRNKPSPISSMTVPASSGFSFDSIKQNMTVTACTNVISNAISILPLNLYRKDPKTGARAKSVNHPLYRMTKFEPNPSESPTVWINKALQHILFYGNAYLYYERGQSSAAGYWLNPRAVERRGFGVNVKYYYGGKAYGPEQILHIPSLITDDAGAGYAPVDMARAAVLLGIQLDEYSLSSFGNGLNTKLLIDIAEMTKDVKNEDEASKIAGVVADYVKRHYTGAENAGKPLVVWNGMKLQELTHQSSNRDAELLESRKWQELEICKVFGVPPFLVNGSYEVKYGGLEQAMTVFANFTLAPYLRHIEQRLNTLLEPSEQVQHYFEFDMHVLLRPDEKTRAEFYNKLFMMGAIDANGICARENIEPPAEAGHVRFVPAQLMPLTQANIDAYMASQKIKIQDPARAAGDDKRAAKPEAERRNDMRETRRLDVFSKAETRKTEDGRMILRGLIPYNSRSEEMFGFVEQIDPTAFHKSLADRSNVYLFWAHDESRVLAATGSRTLSMRDTPIGLEWEAELREGSADYFQAVQRGDVDGVSFGFIVRKEEWDMEQEPAMRTLKEVQLLEISAGVAFPAYPGAQSEAARRSVESELPRIQEMRSKYDAEKQTPAESLESTAEQPQALDSSSRAEAMQELQTAAKNHQALLGEFSDL